MSARSVCSGRRPCRYHSERAISLPFRRPETRTLMPLQPKRSAESTDFLMARRKLTRDVLAHQLCVQLRLVDLENVDKDFAVGPLLNVSLQLVDLRALAADDDA